MEISKAWGTKNEFGKDMNMELKYGENDYGNDIDN